VHALSTRVRPALRWKRCAEVDRLAMGLLRFAALNPGAIAAPLRRSQVSAID
jgi:hypothetical protein